jgi:hypothetical protein
MWVMIDDNDELEIVEIVNVSDDTLTDRDNNKYNIEKAKYIWEKGVPMDNPKYIQRHLLEEENGN